MELTQGPDDKGQGPGAAVREQLVPVERPEPAIPSAGAAAGMRPHGGFGSYAAAMLARDPGGLAATLSQVERTIAQSMTLPHARLTAAFATAVPRLDLLVTPSVAALMPAFRTLDRVAVDWAKPLAAAIPKLDLLVTPSVAALMPAFRTLDRVAVDWAKPLAAAIPKLDPLPLVSGLNAFGGLTSGLMKDFATPAWSTTFARVAADFARPMQALVANMAFQALPWHELLGDAVLGYAQAAAASWARLRSFARAALTAALRARDAAIHGRSDELDEFLTEWLYLRPTPLRRHALAAALLQDEWLPDDPDDFVLGVLDEIALLTEREVRNHKWLGETQIRGRRIAALDAPLPGTDQRLSDILVAPRAHAGLDFSDPRLDRLLRQLPATERAVVLARGSAETWELAAVEVGQSAAFGQRVRRKCKRLAAELARRDGMSRTCRTGLPAARAPLSAS